jgi:hypothetical protein
MTPKLFADNVVDVASEVELVQNPSPYIYPRVYFASRAESVNTDEAIGKVAQALTVCASCKDLLDKKLESDYVEGPVTSGLDDSGSIDFRESGDRIVLGFPASPGPRYLVLNEGYSPRWHAEADGKTLPVYPTNVVMRGVMVPPGVSEVVLTYRSFLADAWGYILAVLGVTVGAWWIAGGFLRKRGS